MKTKRLSKSVKTIILALILLVVISSFVLTLAYFQDKKEYSGTLDFGNIKLKVSGGVEGDGVTTSTSKLVFNTARKKNNDSTWTGKYMPGDLVEINLTVGLEENSEPAYYMVFISDENEYFETSAYYGIKDSSGNLKIYKSDGQKVVLQSDNSEQTNIYCGKITKTETHNLTISAKIKDELETQGTSTTVSCKVCAIQQANLTEENAQQNINEEFGDDLLKVDTRTKAEMGSEKNFDGTKYYVGITANNYWEGYVENSIVEKDEISFLSKNSGFGIGFDILCKFNESYILTFNTTEYGCVYIGKYNNNGEWISMDYNPCVSGKKIVITGNTSIITVVFRTEGSNKTATFTNFKLVKIY